MLSFLKSMVSEANGEVSSNRITVILLTLAGIFVATVQRDLAMSSMLFGFAFGNKQVGKALEAKGVEKICEK